MKKTTMKKMIAFVLATCALTAYSQEPSLNDGLIFDASAKTRARMTMHDGSVVSYMAYERLYYVTNVEDSAYQYMNIYVPEGATEESPIFLRTYVGGYMAAKARGPQADDATGRALQ